mmetsp:Transcript_48880/g.156302  ORF Transcript_48880/g.156302 Transcript_48880/m.156302 type:complete len:229 (+) Transcript_48880:124-810(+)
MPGVPRLWGEGVTRTRRAPAHSQGLAEGLHICAPHVCFRATAQARWSEAASRSSRAAVVGRRLPGGLPEDVGAREPRGVRGERGRGAVLLGARVTGRGTVPAVLAPFGLLFLEHATDLRLYDWVPQHVRGGGPALLLALKQVAAEPLELGRVPRGDRGRGPARDPRDQGPDVRGIERHAQGGHLKEDAAHGPDVAAPAVGLLLADLGAQVVGRAYGRFGEGGRAVQHL